MRKKSAESEALWKAKECIIALDQSYSRTGIAIAVNGKLKKVAYIDFKNTPTKTGKRLELQRVLRKVIETCLKKYSHHEVAVICERLRTFTSGTDLRPDVIKPAAAMIAYIVDTAMEYEIGTWSADTRAWKSKVLGSSKPIFEPIIGVKNPQKFGSVRKVIELGFEKSIRIENAKGVFKSYCDDAADAACMALYPFILKPNLKKEI